jgi:hypothetical protein
MWRLLVVCDWPGGVGNGRARFSASPFLATPVASLLPALMLLSCAQPPKKDPVIPGIDKPTAVVAADFERLFPCLNAGLRKWEHRHNPGCVGGTRIEPYRSPQQASEILIFVPLFDIGEDAVTQIRREVPPMYGQVMQYLFPHWPQASAWLYRSLENTRETGCPRIAHIRDVWLIVRPGYAAGAQDLASVMIIRSPDALAGWRKLDEPMCDRLPFVEEIG